LNPLGFYSPPLAAIKKLFFEGYPVRLRSGSSSKLLEMEFYSAREMPFISFYFVIFSAFGALLSFFLHLGHYFAKKIDRSIFFPFIEKSFPIKIYFQCHFRQVA